MVDACDSKSHIARCESSSLSSGTCTEKMHNEVHLFSTLVGYGACDLRHMRETRIGVAELLRRTK